MPEPPLPSSDIFIAGGGLAGLALSIQLARSGFRVILAEKERYPFHRVCGEYISMESWPFLERLGLPVSSMGLPKISQLTVTGPNGRKIEHHLPLGGFGISRYTLDQQLAAIARDAGVTVLEETRVVDILSFPENPPSPNLRSQEVAIPHGFRHATDISLTQVLTNAGTYQARVAVGSFGKRSNLDIRWKRPHAGHKTGPLHNYIGVKYHIEYDFPRDHIALHNFSNGYCGISAVEGNKYCLCYLTTAENLRRCNNSIKSMEASILSVNPYLRDIFANAKFLWTEPVTISQVSFARKELIRDHTLFCGDAAGMITPLCGNGMSMALHGSKILASLLESFLTGRLTREQLEKKYTTEWTATFAGRLRAGRMIQSIFGRPLATNLFIGAMKPFPALVGRLIQSTHGKPF
ncbi:MAG: FAD-dependent monooxygenase [Chitinophagaceae bacterium]|nr:FAD-dependent monooxygenase [Chitinophagaceae bacterium]